MVTENMHIISEHHCASVLRDMLRRQERHQDKVVLFGDALCHGRLSLDRRHYWRELMRGKPAFPFTPYELSLVLNNMQRPLDMLPQWLAHDTPVWLWCSDSLQDELMRCQLLRHVPPQQAGLFHTVRYAARGRTMSGATLPYTAQYPAAAHLAECERYAEPVTAADIQAATTLWQQLAADNEPLRYRSEGKILSAPEGFYDAVLLNAAEVGWNKALMLVARASACLTDSPGHEFLLMRLARLIEQGALLARHMEHYWPEVDVCLPQEQAIPAA